MKISRERYASLYGPTAGDRLRLGDTNLILEVEKDLAIPGEEAVFGGGKTIRDGMAQSQRSRSEGAPDLVITNAAGKKQTEKEVLAALAKPMTVLISSDGKDVDPYYLQIVRPNTLVIVVKGEPWSDVIDSALRQ